MINLEQQGEKEPEEEQNLVKKNGEKVPGAYYSRKIKGKLKSIIFRACSDGI